MTNSKNSLNVCKVLKKYRQKATDPSTSAEQLSQLAIFFPNETKINPARRSIAAKDPKWLQDIELMEEKVAMIIFPDQNPHLQLFGIGRVYGPRGDMGNCIFIKDVREHLQKNQNGDCAKCQDIAFIIQSVLKQ